jgi:DNA-binding YbaB/EbfC family protein
MTFGGMNIGEIQRQARELKAKLERIEEDLRERVVEGTAGGGMVRVRANGLQEIVDVKVDPQVVVPGEKGMLEDLVMAASNEALRKARKLRETELAKATGGLPLPGLF